MADKQIQQFFDELPQHADKEQAKGMHAVYQFSIDGEGGGVWQVRVEDGKVDVNEGTPHEADLTLKTGAPTFRKIVAAELSGQTAFLTGQVRAVGDMSLALKLQGLFHLS